VDSSSGVESAEPFANSFNISIIIIKIPLYIPQEMHIGREAKGITVRHVARENTLIERVREVSLTSLLKITLISSCIVVIYAPTT
jgi:hypothetical protein